VLYAAARFRSRGREALLSEDGLGLLLLLQVLDTHPAACAEQVLVCIGWLAGTKHEYQVALFAAGAVHKLADSLREIVAGKSGLSPALHGFAVATAIATMCRHSALPPNIVGAFVDAGVVPPLQLLGPTLAYQAERLTNRGNPVTVALQYLLPTYTLREKIKAAAAVHVAGVLADPAGGRWALEQIRALCVNACMVRVTSLCMHPPQPPHPA
jgi:hypothetical protein